MQITLLLSLVLLALVALPWLAVPPASAGEDAAKVPVELGKVRWSRSFEQARATAKADGKAMLVLFQEVPG